jgi:uncharacterized protein YkwD
MLTNGRFSALLIGLASSALLLGVVPGADTAPTVSAPVQLVATATPTKAQARPAILTAVNTERRKAGCAALTSDSRLLKAAQGHASDMSANNYFSHTGRNGSSFVDRIRAAGITSFRTGAENIAKGQRTSAQVMTAWMNSAGHRRNILNCAFTKIGIGFESRGNYWVQDFTG